MTTGTFGERLRREREMRGVSLEEIAAATRIGVRFLTAFENEQWDRLPGGVFNRGFIRAIARFLGLDEEAMVAEYTAATSDPSAALRPGPSATLRPGQGDAVVAAKAHVKPARAVWPWVAALLVVGALAVGGWFGYRRYLPRIQAWRAAHRSAPAAPLPAVSQTSPPNSSPAPAPATTASPAAGAVEPATLELKVEAGRATRLVVLSDGKTVFDGELPAGESRRFQAKERFEVSAGDSGAVLLELNGQTVPPLGPPGRPGSATLTRADLKKQKSGVRSEK